MPPQAGISCRRWCWPAGWRACRRLEQQVLGTIDTWYRVWKELGYIPSGYRSKNLKVASWEMSDAGNYAHLMKTIAFWLMYQAGTSDWEQIKAQAPARPLPHKPLPASVLRAQGLAE